METKKDLKEYKTIIINNNFGMDDILSDLIKGEILSRSEETKISLLKDMFEEKYQCKKTLYGYKIEMTHRTYHVLIHEFLYEFNEVAIYEKSNFFPISLEEIDQIKVSPYYYKELLNGTARFIDIEVENKGVLHYYRNKHFAHFFGEQNNYIYSYVF